MDYRKVSQEILREVGGKENVISASHCITRLRLVLKDEKKANDSAVEEIDGVKSVVKQGGQYQVVIGNEVSNVAKEFMKYIGGSGQTEEVKADKSQEKWYDRLLGYISGSMTVLLPALLGCGMLKVILIIMTLCGFSDKGTTYTLLSAVSDSCFQFLPVLLAYGTAKKLGSNPIVSMTIAAVFLYPSVTDLFQNGCTGTFLGMDCTYLFGIPVISTTYASSVLPVLLLAPIIKAVEDWADRVSPNMVKSFMKPLITILVCSVVGLVVVGPLGGVCGQGLYIVINWMYTHVSWLALMIVAGFYPLIVMTGMHYALVPIAIVSLTTVGFDPLMCTAMSCSNVAMGGAALGVSVKTKNKKLKSEATASGISACIAGVTEPTLYGIALKYKTPLIAAMVGGGVAGLFGGLTSVVTYAMGGSPSLLSVIQMVGGDGISNLIFGIIMMAVALGLAFILCLALYKDKMQEDRKASDVKNNDLGKEEISAPIAGRVVALSEVPDEVFSTGVMGTGVAIEPAEGLVTAPCSGVVSAVMETKHAVGMTSEQGVELLIHVGLDTVQLGGKHFECFVENQQKVKKGDVLLKFDLDALKAEGYKTVTPVIIANSSEFSKVDIVGQESVKTEDVLIVTER